MGIGVTSFASGRMKKVIESHAKQYEPEDPYYEEHIDPTTNKLKKRKRAPPPGLTKAQAKLLRKIQRRAHYLDKGFSLCGLRFGWTFILGIIPGVGDAADALLNYTLVVKPARSKAELPDWLYRQMLFNNAVSAGVGLVPLAGDIFLAIWKANSRNAKLLEEFFRVLGEDQVSKGLPDLTVAPAQAHPAQSAAKALLNENSAPAAGSTV